MDVIEKLRKASEKISHDSPNKLFRETAENWGAKNDVISIFGNAFAQENLPGLSAEKFRSFLLYENNRHWTGLHRMGGMITENMDALREALSILTDESTPIRERLDRIRPKKGQNLVKGLGRGIITAILQVVFPEKYGVLNSTAESGMRANGLWPDFAKGASFGERYERINGILVETASNVGVDLWTLDSLWWVTTLPDEDDNGGLDRGGTDPSEITGVFGLEKFLHAFLEDNWKQLDLGKHWDLLEVDGEVVGSHYQTGEVGEIDLLAKHKTQKEWLVIELKRNQSSDSTVGQMLRYRGWVRRRLAKKGDKVQGLVICGEVDKKMQYALDGLDDVNCMTYRVNFTLSSTPALPD